MQAPKNGFFYVLDRATGGLISAEPFATVTWAKGIDPKTGRPIEVEGLDYRSQVVTLKPSPVGAHNWQPMAFHPKTGLVYIPTQEMPFLFHLDPDFRYRPGAWNVGYDMAVADALPRDLVSGQLLAWDPVRQRAAWRVPYTTAWNGGVLATAGNLVFQGTASGSLVAYRASDGERLWQAPAGTGIVAPPISYELDGEQYVAVMAGWGGTFALVAGDAAAAAGVSDNAGRLLVFKLGGQARLPAPAAAPRELAAVPGKLDPELVRRGGQRFHQWCSTCHGIGAVGGGVVPDLRRSDPAIYGALDAIVLAGARLGGGMPRFDRWLTSQDVAAIRTYLLSRRAALAAEPVRAGGS
jgi:quinohemoprotein ethanol dehydrogenase